MKTEALLSLQVVNRAKASKAMSGGDVNKSIEQTYRTLEPTVRALAKTALLTAFAGLVGGLMGIGGGMIMGPLMLELGVHPQVRSASFSSEISVTSPQKSLFLHYDVSFYDSTASTWTLATPRATWESLSII